ncbi:hypothetical protein [Rubrolithibacter danxiaensis]|uniref:hypothetical protein n=1 Tax=Rubrolithibacter danxiaensis TaxID=3390805 RepID=UPI003BF82F60
MNTVKELAATLHEVFRTESGVIYQSDKEKCLLIDFDGKICKFNYQQAVRLKKIIEAIDVEKILLDSQSSTLEIIALHGCEHIYLLSVIQILQFKELLQGAFVMFQLNHIINDCLHRLVV